VQVNEKRWNEAETAAEDRPRERGEERWRLCVINLRVEGQQRSAIEEKQALLVGESGQAVAS